MATEILDTPAIEAALALAEKATPGPWTAESECVSEKRDLWEHFVDMPGTCGMFRDATPRPDDPGFEWTFNNHTKPTVEGQSRDTAIFIAAARTLVPDLAATALHERARADSVAEQCRGLVAVRERLEKERDAARESARVCDDRATKRLEELDRAIVRTNRAETERDEAIARAEKAEAEVARLRTMMRAYADEHFPRCNARPQCDRLAVYAKPIEAHGQREEYFCADCGEPTGGVKIQEAEIVEALATEPTALRAEQSEVAALRAKVARLREALEEIYRNTSGVAEGGLPHFSKKDLASAAAHVAKRALAAPETAGKDGGG